MVANRDWNRRATYLLKWSRELTIEGLSTFLSNLTHLINLDLQMNKNSFIRTLHILHIYKI